MFSLQTPHFDTKISHMYTLVQTLPQFIPTYKSKQKSMPINEFLSQFIPYIIATFVDFRPVKCQLSLWLITPTRIRGS